MGIQGFVRRPSFDLGNVVLRRSKAFAIAALVLVSLPSNAIGSQPVKGARWTWPRGSRVSVELSSEFSVANGSVAAVASAFRGWERAGRPDANGSGVTFTFGPASTPFRYHVAYGRVAGGGQAHTVIVSAAGGVLVAWTTIDRRVTDPVALSHVMSHEIGHTFGLAECDACAAGSSVMTRYSGDFNDVVNGRNAPSAEDTAAVRRNGGY